MPLATDAKQHRLPSLDGLRGLSIGLVVLGHAMATIANVPLLPTRAKTILGNAELGVSFFFVISGYLITHLLLGELKETGAVSFHDFYIRRVTRILPAFYSYLAFLVVLSSSGYMKLPAVDVLVAASFTWNYSPFGSGSWWLGHTWSLCIEEQFYLLWPITLVSLGAKSAARLAASIILLEPLIRVVSYLLWPSYRARIPVMLHTRADVLMFGCLLALREETRTFSAALDRLARPLSVAIVAAVLFIIDPLLVERFRGSYILPIGFTLEAASITLLIFVLIKPRHSLAWSFFNSRSMRWVGIRSYGLYLWQQLFLTTKNTTIAGVFPINIIGALTASAVSYRLVEEPAMSARGRFLRAGVAKAPLPRRVKD